MSSMEKSSRRNFFQDVITEIKKAFSKDTPQPPSYVSRRISESMASTMNVQIMNLLDKLENKLKSLLEKDEKQCLLYMFCKEAVTSKAGDTNNRIAPMLQALRFILKSLPAISSMIGISTNQKLLGLKAFAAAGFTGVTYAQNAACRKVYPACPDDRDQYIAYIKKYTEILKANNLIPNQNQSNQNNETDQTTKKATLRRNPEKVYAVPKHRRRPKSRHATNSLLRRGVFELAPGSLVYLGPSLRRHKRI